MITDEVLIPKYIYSLCTIIDKNYLSIAQSMGQNWNVIYVWYGLFNNFFRFAWKVDIYYSF